MLRVAPSWVRGRGTDRLPAQNQPPLFRAPRGAGCARVSLELSPQAILMGA